MVGGSFKPGLPADSEIANTEFRIPKESIANDKLKWVISQIMNKISKIKYSNLPVVW